MDNIIFNEKKVLTKKCKYCNCSLSLKKSWEIIDDGKIIYSCQKCIPNKEYYEEKKYSKSFIWGN